MKHSSNQNDHDSNGTYSEGDRVLLEDTHHAHNSELKKNEGLEGVVVTEPGGYNDKYLVEFEGRTLKMNNRFWVHPKWLKRTQDTESDNHD